MLCYANNLPPWWLSTSNQANRFCQVISQETESLLTAAGAEHVFNALGHQYKLRNLCIHVSSPLKEGLFSFM